MCLPVTGAGGAGGAGGGAGLACGQGTVERGGVCVVAPPATITSARLTLLDVRYNPSKPAYIANPIPIRFGITAESADPSKPATTSVTVLFSMVEEQIQDPAAPKSCLLAGTPVSLVGDGKEQYFEVDLLPSSECAALSVGKINLQVDFDQGAKNPAIDYPAVTFAASEAAKPDNQRCRTKSDPQAPKPGLGCVYSLDLENTPKAADGTDGLDLQLDSLKPDSSIATLWPLAQDPNVPVGQKETEPPALTVDAKLLVFGKDPYKHKVDLSKLPPEVAKDPATIEKLKFGMDDTELDGLDDLPGSVEIRYELAPADGPDTKAWAPLLVDDPKNPDPDGHVESLEIKELNGGAAKILTHDLFIDPALRTKLSAGGDWAKYDEFTVRGCLTSSFPEAGNDGDAEEDGAEGDAGNKADNCKSFKVKLVKASPPVANASSYSFDAGWTKSVGSADLLQINGVLRTANTLDLNGARTDNEGYLDVSGKLGTLRLFRAYGKAAALTAQAQSNVDLGVEVFGVNLFGYQNTASEFTYSVPFTLSKSYNFPGLSFGYGPVQIGVTVGVGGSVGLTPSFTVSAKQGGEPSVPALADASSSGLLGVTLTPSAGLTGNAFGGIDLFIARAGVQATMQVVEVGFPVSGNLRWGVTELSGETVKKITVVGQLTWDLTVNWCNIKVELVGSIGICFLCIGRSIPIFEVNNPTQKVNLLTRQLGEPLVLE